MKFHKINIKYSVPVLTVFILLATACNDFLDINTDPSFADNASNIQLMPAAQASAVLAFSNMLERGPATLVQHYINGRFDNYGFDGSTYNNDWSFHLYNGALEDFQVIIDQGTAEEQWHHVGVAKIFQAYAFSLLVDLFGDVPFSEALQASGNFNPSVDPGEEVYPQLIALIDAGVADLDREATLSLGAEDLVYGGDLEGWKKMANTLKLKMYNQTRMVDPSASTSQINSLLAEGNLISEASGDFSFRFTTSNAPEGRHPNFQADYAAGGLENNLSIFFINLLNGNTDPRIPYYFYKQTGCSLGGVNGGEGSSAGDDNVRAIQGIYPIGGAYDDNSCQVHSESIGLQGAGIFPMITNTMRLFIETEAALTLGTAGDPRALLEASIRASLAEVSGFGGSPTMAATDIETYVSARMAAYDAATNADEQLEVIMLEKYVALFGNGIESYNDLRRTGYPNNLNVPIIQNGSFPLRFPIPPVEVTANENIDPVADLTKPVFWDK